MITSAPGFFGKVTSHGDFVSRRLPAAVVAAWDGWLQRCLVHSRAQLGAGWLAKYLTSPVWRFALAEGILGEQAWVGIMMPSVDRVGRHYPLLIAAPAAAGTALIAWTRKAHGWYDELENRARSSLEADFMLEVFDRALADQPAGAAGGSAPDHGSTAWRLPLREQEQMPDALLGVLLHGRSLWWSEGSPDVEPSLLVCEGMPPESGFAAMLAGQWREHGWAAPPSI